MSTKIEAAEGARETHVPTGDERLPLAPQADAEGLWIERRMLLDEISRLRRKTVELTAQNDRLRQTISFQLGSALLQAKNLRGLAELPRRLWDIRQDSVGRRRDLARRDPTGLDDPALEYEALDRLIAQLGSLSADEIVAQAEATAPRRATAQTWLVDLAKMLRLTDVDKAVQVARWVAESDPKPYRLAWLAGLMHDAGMVTEPAAVAMRAKRGGASFSEAVQARLNVIEGLERVRAYGLSAPPRAAGSPDPGQSVLYLAASSYPHHLSGYTVRTHQLIKAVQKAGWSVEAATRAGYPWDRSDARNVEGRKAAYEVDGVTYRRLAGPASNRTALDAYVEAGASAVAELAASSDVAVVHAASNHVNALPALIGARRAGKPFVYEVRGLWEFTAASRAHGWEQTERFQLARELEGLAAREADAVLTLSAGLKQELIERGVAPERITIVPNCVDVAAFGRRAKNRALVRELGLEGRTVLGFIGSVLDYEGLDDLVVALAALAAEERDVVAVVVGDGAALLHVREMARRLHVADRLITPGRVAPEEVVRWYSVMDVMVYPRRPAVVTELVPPLKPLEAMAMGLPVVASDVAALAEIVRDGVNGLLFAKGQTGSLVEVLRRVVDDKTLARSLGRKARAFVEQERDWSVAARLITAAYASVLDRAD